MFATLETTVGARTRTEGGGLYPSSTSQNNILLMRKNYIKLYRLNYCPYEHSLRNQTSYTAHFYLKQEPYVLSPLTKNEGCERTSITHIVQILEQQ